MCEIFQYCSYRSSDGKSGLYAVRGLIHCLCCLVPQERETNARECARCSQGSVRGEGRDGGGGGRAIPGPPPLQSEAAAGDLGLRPPTALKDEPRHTECTSGSPALQTDYCNIFYSKGLLKI